MRRRWVVRVLEPVGEWLNTLKSDDPDAYRLVTAAIDLLEEEGPALGRPMADRIEGSKYNNMKELRPQTIRVLFIFDPQREAILLTAGDKRDKWKQWYEDNIPLAEQRYEEWLVDTRVDKPAQRKGRKRNR